MEKSDHDLSSNQNPLARQLDFSVPAAAAETKMIDSSQETEKKLSQSLLLDSQSYLEDQRDEELSESSQPTEEQHRLGAKSLEEPSATEDVTPPPQKPPIHRFGHPLEKCRVRYNYSLQIIDL